MKTIKRGGLKTIGDIITERKRERELDENRNRIGF